MPIVVFADDSSSKKSYINDNNVVMDYTMYQNMSKIYSQVYINAMTQQEYDEFIALNIDFSTLKQDVKYIKTEYNQKTNKFTDTLITKEEYDNVTIEPQTRASVVETTYKKLMINTSSNWVCVTNVWKNMPAKRSYDVLAARVNGFYIINGTQSGKQIYKENGNTNTINYSWNGSNTKRFSNGIGFSMNLINSTSINYLENILQFSAEMQGSTAAAFGSYQHATKDVTKAQSMNYTLGSGGLGNVIKFNNGIGNNYDGMQGVSSYVYS